MGNLAGLFRHPAGSWTWTGISLVFVIRHPAGSWTGISFDLIHVLDYFLVCGEALLRDVASFWRATVTKVTSWYFSCIFRLSLTVVPLQNVTIHVWLTTGGDDRELRTAVGGHVWTVTTLIRLVRGCTEANPLPKGL